MVCPLHKWKLVTLACWYQSQQLGSSLARSAGDYWGWFGKRSYHHTGPVSTFYAMREALAIIAEEGLENMWARHLECHQQLWDGLKSLGLQSFVEKDEDR